MGERSQQTGEKLENYACKIFKEFEWNILARNVQIVCRRTSHKNPKNKNKKTHGVDILAGYYNPFKERKEAFIIECKNRAWSNYTPSTLSSWIEELCNTVECASISQELSEVLKEYTLIGGILLYHSSDNKYESNHARSIMSKIKVPKRRSPFMIYLADNNRLNKWNSFIKSVNEIKQDSDQNSFEIIYPSIGGSTWDRNIVVTSTYLFSDYILASYTKKTQNTYITITSNIKVIFCFDHDTEDSMKYLQDMINELQLEATLVAPLEIHCYFYPETEKDIDSIKRSFKKIFENKTNYKFTIMDNREIAEIDLQE